MEFLPIPEKRKESKDGIRVLTQEEIESIRPIFENQGQPLPDPTVSCVVGAIEDGKVVGFLVLQLRLHAEPMWIEEGRSALFTPLVNAAENVIITRIGPQWVYVFTPAGRVSQMAASMGMQLEPWCVYSKLVMHSIPTKPTIDLAIMDLEQHPVEGGVQ